MQCFEVSPMQKRWPSLPSSLLEESGAIGGLVLLVPGVLLPKGGESSIPTRGFRPDHPRMESLKPEARLSS